MGVVEIIALSMGVAWASGINLYAAIFVLGWLGSSGSIALPDGLQICTDPLVMTAAAVMYCVEFFTDKIPGVDTLWDTLHTFIRIPAGAILAAGAVGDLGQGAELAALLIGGTLSSASHATKAGSRVLINASPEPVTNWIASITEDVAVVLGLWTALHHPVLFLLALVVMVAAMVWLLPKLWRGIKLLFAKVVALFKGGAVVPAAEKSPPQLTPPDSDK